jgi:hypothetical protein
MSLLKSYIKINTILQLEPNTKTYINLKHQLTDEEQQVVKQLKQKQASHKHYQMSKNKNESNNTLSLRELINNPETGNIIIDEIKQAIQNATTELSKEMNKTTQYK